MGYNKFRAELTQILQKLLNMERKTTAHCAVSFFSQFAETVYTTSPFVVIFYETHSPPRVHLLLS